MSDNEDDGPVDPEPMIRTSELRSLLVEAAKLGDRLREAQFAALRSPEDDDTTAVLLGMASRLYRLLVDFLERPSAWSPLTAPYFVRPLVEARIVSAWLMLRRDPALIAAYREHGLGNLKLLREHIKNDLGESDDEEAREFLEHLDGRVNLEIDEWAQTVNVGAFSNATIRQMAIDCDLKRLYDLSFAPMSAENHGEWVSVRDIDTARCTEPLHGGHRVGRFTSSSHEIGPQAARAALDVATDGITAIFGHYDIDVSGAFHGVEEAFSAALYSPDDEASS